MSQFLLAHFLLSPPLCWFNIPIVQGQGAIAQRGARMAQGGCAMAQGEYVTAQR